MRVLLALLVLVPLAGASSPRDPVDVTVASEGSGAVGEPIRLRLTWRIEPGLAQEEVNASLDVPDWVRVEGADRWTLHRGTRTVEVVLTPQREGYWRVGVRTDGPFLTGRHVLAVRSAAGDGAVGRMPEDVLPARGARVDATLGAWNATHAEVIVRGAKEGAWLASERLALAPAGQGHVSTVAGDEGEHREAFEVAEGVGLLFTATAYVEATFEGPAYSDASTVWRHAVAKKCYTVSRSGGNVTLDGGECRYPVPSGAWAPFVALAAATALLPCVAGGARAPASAGASRRASPARRRGTDSR